MQYRCSALVLGGTFFYNQNPITSFSAMHNTELQSVVERLCEDGCQAVTQYIVDIQAGRYPRAMQHLSRPDCEAVLAELKSIMAVYERRNVH